MSLVYKQISKNFVLCGKDFWKSVNLHWGLLINCMSSLVSRVTLGLLTFKHWAVSVMAVLQWPITEWVLRHLVPQPYWYKVYVKGVKLQFYWSHTQSDVQWNAFFSWITSIQVGKGNLKIWYNKDWWQKQYVCIFEQSADMCSCSGMLSPDQNIQNSPLFRRV